MSISSVAVTSPNTNLKKTTANTATNDESFQEMMKEKLVTNALNDDRHINTFVEQTLAKAPESEKQIWLRMKEELGI